MQRNNGAGAGKRPLFISGSQRQMLHDIKENLLHVTLQQQPQIAAAGDAKADGMQIKTDLGPSTQDKMTSSAGAGLGLGGSNTRDAAYNKQAMAQIRRSLEVYQAANSVTKTVTTSTQAALYEEESNKTSGNMSDFARRLDLNDTGRNGLTRLQPGLTDAKVNRKPSFEDKYQSSPGNSENSSVRSDSPSLGITHRQFLENRMLTGAHNANLVLVGAQESLAMYLDRHTPPPPLPPRGKLPANNLGRNHTPPPPPMQGEQHKTGQLPASHLAQRANVNVQPLSRGQALLLNGQHRPSSVLPNRNQAMMATGPLSPTTSDDSSSTSSMMYSSSSSSVYNQTSTMTYSQPPPPPYSLQNRPSPTFPHHIPAEQSHMVVSPLNSQQGGFGQSPLSSHSPSPGSSARMSPGVNNQAMANQLFGQSGQAGLKPAAMQAWPARQPGIVMQKVNSRQVARPVLQTATGPVLSSSSSGPHTPESLHSQLSSPPLPQPQHPSYSAQQLQHVQQLQQQPQIHQQYVQHQHVQVQNTQVPHNQYKFVSQVTQIQEQVTVSSGQGRHPVGVGRGHAYTNPDLEQTGHSQAQHYAIHGNDHLGRTIQINIKNQAAQMEQQWNNRVAAYGDNHSAMRPGLQAFPETPMSTPRSESPVPRGYNQSPVSVISTGSTPSTNSDAIPDKPPPPYPGPGFLAASIQQQFQYLASQLPLPGPAVLDDVSSTTSSDKADNDTKLENETTSSDKDSYTSSTKSSEQSYPDSFPSLRERYLEQKRAKIKNYSPQAYKFYMEQHIENLLKSHDQRKQRREQLETEMAKCGLSKEAQDQMRKMLEKKESNYIRQKRAKMNKSMFDKIKTLGVGAFGEVALISKKDTNQLFAMKTLRKRDVLLRNQAAHVKAERDILAEADNEWVVKLYYSFQDKDNLYFVMDYIPGGDMMSLLIKLGVFEENLAQFYIAELVAAIESVHKMGFIHRDIKPDNILIDKEGHIKLTDFGLCTGFRWTHNSKYYQKGSHARQDSMEPYEKWGDNCHCGQELHPHEKELLKPLERRKKQHQRCLAHSLVGTPNYIAPEILLRIGYSAVCDWWSVGVILYEMLVGQPPFLANTPSETQYKVINWQSTLHIPKGANLSTPAVDIIIRLCCDHGNRLGGNGAEEVKAHPFFSNINFETLRKTRALYVPTIRHPTDTSNFDPVEPEKLRDSNKRDGTLENGKQPDHAFFEFTFRRFFDETGNLYMPMEHDPEFGDDIVAEEKELFEEEEEEEDGAGEEDTDSQHSQSNKGPAVYV